MSKETVDQGKAGAQAHNTQKDSTSTVDSTRQLHEIRDLLFGEQLRSVHQRTDELEYRLQKQLQEMTAAFSNALKELQDDTQMRLAELGRQSQSIDEKHTQKTTMLSADIQAVADELEKKYQELVDKLAATSNDLKNNKTDRKMLANLLAGMANNLSLDEQN